MTQQKKAAAPESKLYKAYFNDPTLSDLTIRLRDGTAVHAHRIVLCRGSAYFDSLITDRIKRVERVTEELTVSVLVRPGSDKPKDRLGLVLES